MHTLPWSFVRILGLQLGLEGMGPSWATSGRYFHSLTEGRKGAAGAASMLYCFPPGTLFLLERPKWYSRGEERARRKLGKGTGDSKSILGQYIHHLPRSLSFGLTYPPESSKKSSGGREAGGGKEGARNLSRSPLMGSGWEALSP